MKERETTEERLGPLFTPDTLLPSQFFDRVRRRVEHDGERRLMIAVLEDAVDVYRKQAAAQEARGQQLFREAEEWIEDLGRTWLFSFENICDVLDIDSEYVRPGLHAWKERARRGQSAKRVALHTDDDDGGLRQAGGDWRDPGGGPSGGGLGIPVPPFCFFVAG